jgi:hypothetical protein
MLISLLNLFYVLDFGSQIRSQETTEHVPREEHKKKF